MFEPDGEPAHYMGYLVLQSADSKRFDITDLSGSAGQATPAGPECLRTFIAQSLSLVGDVYPDDNRFKAAFAEKELQTTNSRNNKVARYILFEIEPQRSGQDFDFESAAYSLEHILPEHPSEAWAYIEESKQDRLIYRLVNLTPLETSGNKALGNGDYASKRPVYHKSVFQITRAVAEHYDTWDQQKIEARQKQLASVAAGIWRFED